MNKHIAYLTITAALATPAFAASPESVEGTGDTERFSPGETVKDRYHEGYDPVGARVGSFILYPQVKLSEAYDNNIYRTDGSEVNDWITTLAPSMILSSDWSQHALNVSVGADIARYQDHSSEDTDGYWLNATGRIDVSRQTFVTLEGEYKQESESRGSPDDARGLSPADVDRSRVAAGFEHRPGRIFFRGSAELLNLDYSDVDTSSGGTINNDDRDREQTEVSFLVGYEIMPEFDAFARYTRGQRNYDDTTDDNGFNRDSTSDKIDIGTELDLSGVLVGEVSVGHQRYEYDDPNFDDVDATSAYALLYWHPTPLTSVTFQVEREVSETTAASSSGYMSDIFAVGVYHELLRNLVLEGSLSYVKNDWEDDSRKDDVTTLKMSGEYDANRNLFFGAGYSYEVRDSSSAGLDYDRDEVSIWAGLRL